MTDDVATAYAEAVRGLDSEYFGGMEMSGPGVLRQVLLVPDADPRANLLAEWEGMLAAGATAARLTDPRQLRLVDVFEQRPGEAPPPEPDNGFGVDLHPVQTTDDSDAEIIASVDRTLSGFGLSPVVVRVLHPLGPAVYVVATTPDEQRMRNRCNDLGEALDAHGSYDGVFLQLETAGGRVLMRTYTSTRLTAGGVWFTPGFDELCGIAHG
jgi:hypothetical protein